MIRLFVAWLVLLVIAVPADSAATTGRVVVGTGLSIVVRNGWRVSHEAVTLCGDPMQLFVATTRDVRLHSALRIPRRSALVLLMEGSSGRFPARPARFSLPRRFGNLGGCCEIPVGPGVELLFRDGGRKFYAFVYLGERAPAAARRGIERLLNSLKVSAPD